MGRVWVRELTGGLDTRRMPATTPGGVLIKATDGHISSGGEFQKRAAFVDSYTLPAGTIGLARTPTNLLVFGHLASPSMPSGVSYQRLQHPTPATALVAVLSWDLYAGKVYAVAQFADGAIHHFYDGTRITDWFDGRARASFLVTAGTGASTLTGLKVGGVAVLTPSITWTTSDENTAALIAAAVNSLVSVPDYSATAVDAKVNVIAAVTGTAANGKAVVTTVAGGFEVSPASGILMAGGAVSPGTFTPGSFVKTIGSKMYSTSGSVFHFSGISQPTQWTTDVTGAGFIDMAKETSNADSLVAIAEYQGLVAIFAPSTIIIEYVDPDPDLNRKSQVLANTGTNYPLSVTEFGDADLFYLSESGCRSLRARDSSNAASTYDVGTPIDSLVVEKLKGLSDSERQLIFGLINPVDGRFWLGMKDEIFVFSFYGNAKVSAWTTYKTQLTTGSVVTDFDADHAVVFGGRPFLRSINTIYSYGGLDDDLVYDDTVAKGWLPFLDADKPTEKKNWQGIDAAVEGDWSVYAATQPTDLDVRQIVANLTETTFNRDRVAFEHSCTHVGLHFESAGSGAATLSAAVLHYEGGEDG